MRRAMPRNDSIVFWKQSSGADDGDDRNGYSGDRGDAVVVADGRAAERQPPGSGAFDDPAVPVQAFVRVVDAGDPGGRPEPAQVAADRGARRTPCPRANSSDGVVVVRGLDP